MHISRRGLISLIGKLSLLLSGFLRPFRVAAQAGPTWEVRRATSTDLSALPTIYNRQAEEGICPYSDLSGGWTTETATKFYETYDGSLLLLRDGVPVGFAGLIDYEAHADLIVPGSRPELSIFSLDFKVIPGAEIVHGAKTLGAAVGRQLLAMGCVECTARVSAGPMFETAGSDDWYESHMNVSRALERDGADHARESTFDVALGLAELEAEGY